MISDCANHLEGHHIEMKERSIVVEVCHNTAARWGILGRGPEANWVAVAGLRNGRR